MARRYGVNTRDIILLPIGGVARLDHLPEKPAHEFWVALAGPLVNIALAALFSLYLFNFTPDQRWEIVNGLVLSKGNYFLNGYSELDIFIFHMALLNFILAAFNLIPAFPMDGGRILRALLNHLWTLLTGLFPFSWHQNTRIQRLWRCPENNSCSWSRSQ